MIKNIFDEAVAQEVIGRINNVSPEQSPLWGKMSADQMMAHCNVSYAFTYEPEKFKKPGAFMKFMLKNFVKKHVVTEKPYQTNSRTSPDFIMTGKKDFEKEKSLLIENILKTQQLGFDHFNGLENFSFGKLSGNEWNVLFYKHLDHHLRQFGA